MIIGTASHAALGASLPVRGDVTALNARRSETGLPVTEVYLGLHVGEVFYGNIGSLERLDLALLSAGAFARSVGSCPLSKEVATFPIIASAF